MELLKNCSVTEFVISDEFGNAVDVSYGTKIDSLIEYLKENDIDNRIITAEMEEVSGFKLTPDVDDNTDMLFSVSDKIYAFTFTSGKKKIPSGLMRKEIKKAITKFEKDNGGITSDDVSNIKATVSLNIMSRAFMTYTDVVGILDLSDGKLGRLYVSSTSKSIVKSVNAILFDNLALNDGHRLDFLNYMAVNNDLVRTNILDSIIHERTHDLCDIVFTFKDGEDVVKLTSSSDVMADDDLKAQVEQNMLRFGCGLKSYSYYARDIKAMVESKGTTSAVHSAIGLKLKYFGEPMVVSEEDLETVYGELRSSIYYEICVVRDVLKDMFKYTTTNRE